jgi:hypothetical protein
VHGWPWLHHAVEGIVANWGWMKAVGSILVDTITGVVAGAACVGAWMVIQKFRSKNR